MPGTSPSGPSRTGARRHAGTIILADDEALVRRVTERQLGLMGFDVIAAANGAEALRLFGANADRVSLALLDQTMPDLSGSEVAARMRAVRPGLPVVFFSGYGEADLVDAIGRGGATAFLSKPFTQDELEARIAEALGIVAS